MNANEYQDRTDDTAQYPDGDTDPPGVAYLALGLTGEAGEVADHIKKMLRDDDGCLSPHRLGQIKKELGDTMWYVAQIARRIGVSLEDVMQLNIDKLASRKVRGVIGGSGDER